MRTRLVHGSLSTRLAAIGFAALGAMSLLAACADKGEKAAHLDIAQVPKSDEEADSWLQEQRTLRVKYITDATGEVTQYEMLPSEIMWDVESFCSTVSSGDDCFYDMQGIDRYMCVARTWLAIATAQSDPVSLPLYNTYHLVTDRVTEANAADAAVFAGEYARKAARESVERLAGTAFTACKPAALWLPYQVTGRPASLELAGRAAEAYYLAMSATERAVEATANVSDAARSSSLSPTVSLQRSILGSHYSRAAAAHMLVGGDDGLLGLTTTGGYCLAQQLTPKAQAALQLLRDAAPSPSMLTGDLNTLVNGTTSGALNGSVRERLGAFYKLAELKAGKRAELYYDLTLDDFGKARDYLVQEVSVFNRSPSAIGAAPEPDAMGYYRYAGTGGDRVRVLPDGAWAARARYSLAHSHWYTDPSTVELTTAFDNGPYLYATDFKPTPLENLIAGFQIRARNVLRSSDAFSTTVATGQTAESKEVKGVLASILTANDYGGMLELNGNATTLRGTAYGYTTADKVRIVVGEDGLRCALEGQVEGAPCGDALTGAQYNFPASSMPAACQTNPATLSCLTIHTLPKPAATTLYGTDLSVGGDTVAPNTANGSRNVNTSDITNKKTRLYFVKLKTQGDVEKPGNYELLGGAPFISGSQSTLPVTPSLHTRVAEVLAPSRKNCGVASTTCMGKEFDARLPLEDELSSDGDNVENSWKHYLDLAKQAAQESDLLGKEFQQSVLNKLEGEALRAQRREEKLQAGEAALEGLQQLCGTAIDNRALLLYFSGNDATSSNLDAVAANPVTTCAPGTGCPGDAVCLAGMCVKDPSKLTSVAALANDPDAKKLAECLSGQLERFVTLGDKPLCVYTHTASGSAAPGCPMQDPSKPVDPTKLGATSACPDAASTTMAAIGTVTYACTNAAPAGFSQNIAKPLSYFANDTPPPPASSGGSICAEFRRARKSRLDVPDDATTRLTTPLGRVRSSEVFFNGRFSDTVGRLGFSAKYGGYFDVTEDGVTRWSSGNVTQLRTNGWPHAVPAECTADQAGLFCTSWPAVPTWAQISDMNTRVFEATVAAAAIRGAMDPKKNDLDAYFPALVNGLTFPLDSANTTSTTMYDPSNNPIRETRTKLQGDRGSMITYQWLNGAAGDPIIWVDGGGTTYTTSQLYWLGPLQPYANGKGFLPKLNNPFFVTHGNSAWGFTLGALAGNYDESAGPAILLSSDETLDFWRVIRYVGGTIPKISTRAVIDGFEMLCELDRGHQGAQALPSTFQTAPTDLEQTGNYLQMLADKMEAYANSTILQDVPVGAFLALSSAPQTGDLPQLGGEYGQAVSDLRNAVVSARQMSPIIAAQLKQIKANLEGLRAKLDSIQATKEINELDKWSATLNNITACATSFSFTKIVDSFGSQQAATCINALAQTVIAFRKTSLEDRVLNNDATIAKAEFAEQASQHAETMQVASLALETAIENTKAAINRITSVRKRASVALARSLYLASAQSLDQANYDNAIGALSDISQSRYIAALKNARLMAFYARRAIEQRLGVNLVDLREDLPLVDAPATWEGKACVMNGIESGDPTTNPEGTAIYGLDYIGDYVTKLENLVESYRLVHPFHEGQDTAVISLRDDVLNVRSECSGPGRNLFKYSAELNRPGDWGARGCLSQTVGGVVYPALNCVQAVPAPDFLPTTTPPTTIKVADLAVKGLRGNTKGAQGYILRFGDGLNTCTVAGNCGWLSGAALSQVLELGTGKYRLSWYTRDLSTAYTNATKAGIVVARKAGTTTQNPTTANFVAPVADGDAGERWKRATIEITVPVTGTYEIGFGVTQGTMPTAAQEVTLGGVMLDAIPPSTTTTPTYLASFQPTDGSGNVVLANCEDKTGVNFRAQHWDRQCMHLCSDGFSGNCATGPKYCYREFSFGVAEPWIATGKLFKYSGFARGNYNYRIDSLALNFVGSATRDCSNSDLPDTCYNAGFIPYTILHTGPFYTRNQAGADVEALLFDGTIEHARGLALERYITNPVSSTDHDLLSTYMRNEFAGRPLDGNFTVRMWEEPGVNLDGVEDVQLVLNYRYWTANE
jgi:hypothetical protein